MEVLFGHSRFGARTRDYESRSPRAQSGNGQSASRVAVSRSIASAQANCDRRLVTEFSTGRHLGMLPTRRKPHEQRKTGQRGKNGCQEDSQFCAVDQTFIESQVGNE